MSKKRFIIKIVVKTLIFAILSTIAITFLQSPVITNEIALGQMENSNELYVMWETYNKVAPFVRVIYGCVVAGFIASVAYDIYKFVMKNREKKQ